MKSKENADQEEHGGGGDCTRSGRRSSARAVCLVAVVLVVVGRTRWRWKAMLMMAVLSSSISGELDLQSCDQRRGNDEVRSGER
ncbi:putative proline-rich receptor-like protein kinase PERK3 [Iris pallida]|uniref:Proline-rich receptor-like protein kinase PERK3 n=1 Tax=Iris pallida TaxID=29817 RepID=A0AAX6IJZ9_IRIPA|nr:putative proline-rich receptor-like protein kinase PERK3 [Iris pallida]